MSKEPQLNIFNDSYERCNDDPEFMKRFYEIFMSSSEEIRERFKNTDIRAQEDMLLRSLAYVGLALKKPDVLSKTAIKHDKNHLNIPSHLYSLWLDSLIKTVSLTDAQFNDAIKEAWTAVLQNGINYMISKYNASDTN